MKKKYEVMLEDIASTVAWWSKGYLDDYKGRSFSDRPERIGSEYFKGLSDGLMKALEIITGIWGCYDDAWDRLA